MAWRGMIEGVGVSSVGRTAAVDEWHWNVDRSFKDGSNMYRRDGRTDPMRGWVIAFCWMVASLCK